MEGRERRVAGMVPDRVPVLEIEPILFEEVSVEESNRIFSELELDRIVIRDTGGGGTPTHCV